MVARLTAGFAVIAAAFGFVGWMLSVQRESVMFREEAREVLRESTAAIDGRLDAHDVSSAVTRERFDVLCKWARRHAVKLGDDDPPTVDCRLPAVRAREVK